MAHHSFFTQRGIAQLVEQRSPKPRAEGSSPSAPAIQKSLETTWFQGFFVVFFIMAYGLEIRILTLNWGVNFASTGTACNISVCYIIRRLSIRTVVFIIIFFLFFVYCDTNLGRSRLCPIGLFVSFSVTFQTPPSFH